MAINNKVKVAVIGAANKSILLNPQATEGAVFGKDLFFGDGKTVVTLQNLATALGITKQTTQPVILWNQLAAIPPNVIQVANLSTAGVVRRLPDGTWITQPPTDFQNKPGAPGRRGDRGPPGVPGARGANGTAGTVGATGPGVPGRRGVRGRQGFPGLQGTAGARGVTGSRGADGNSIPGRRGPQGKQGIPGPIGARGATGPQGAAGAASSASGFPGYRQKPAPKARVLPWLDNSASVKWARPQQFVGGVQTTSGALPLIGSATGSTNTCFIEFRDTALTRVGYVGDDSSLTSNLSVMAELGNLRLGAASGNTVNLQVAGADVLKVATNVATMVGNASGVSNQCFLEFRDSALTRIGYVGDGGGTVNNLDIFGEAALVRISGLTGVRLDLNAVEMLTFIGSPIGGSNTATLANTKPGSAVTPTPLVWARVSFGGTAYFIPLWT